MEPLDEVTPLSWRQATTILGIDDWKTVYTLRETGVIQGGPGHAGGGANITFAAIDAYWQNLACRGIDVAAQREYGRQRYGEFVAQSYATYAEQQEAKARVKQQAQEERERRARWEEERPARQAARARKRASQQPEAVRARLGEGDPTERFTAVQAAAILSVAVTTFYRDCRLPLREGGRIFTTRRLLLDRIEREEQRLTRVAEAARQRLNEKERTQARGITISCVACDSVIGWIASRYMVPPRAVHYCFCVPCGEKARAGCLDS